MKPDELVARAEHAMAGIRSRGSRLRLEYAGVSTAYCSDEDVTGGWIERFLEGYFVPADGEGADVVVHSTADPVLFAELQDLAPGRSVPGKHGYAETILADSVAVVRKTADKVSPPETVHLMLFGHDRTVLLVTSGNVEVR